MSTVRRGTDGRERNTPQEAGRHRNAAAAAQRRLDRAGPLLPDGGRCRMWSKLARRSEQLTQAGIGLGRATGRFACLPGVGHPRLPDPHRSPERDVGVGWAVGQRMFPQGHVMNCIRVRFGVGSRPVAPGRCSPLRGGQRRRGNMGRWLRAATVSAVVVATALVVLVATATAGTTQVSGPSMYADCTPPASAGTAPSDTGDYPVLNLDGSLDGCWYTYISEAKGNPSGTYQETGTELFVGCLDGTTCGRFTTTYMFTGKFAGTAVLRGDPRTLPARGYGHDWRLCRHDRRHPVQG